MFRKLLSRILSSPRFIAVAALLVIGVGIVAAKGLKTDLFPPLNFPILNIVTEVPSFSPLEMERQVTLPLESAVGGVLGVTRVRSTSATGISMVSAEFAWGTNMLQARQLLIEALSQIRAQLPAGAEPTIESLSATLAMIEGYSFRGGNDLVQLRDTAVYGLKPRLQRIPGVYKVVVMGGKVLEYAVYPNPLLLVKYDVSLSSLKDALAANNILATPGAVNHFSQELVVHANGQFRSPADIEGVVIAVKNATPVRVRDVARVAGAFQYERGDTSEKGVPAVLINVYKQPAFDTVGVARAVEKEIAQFKASLPEGLSVTNYYDQAELVSNSLGSVKESVWIGALLVVLVLGLFLWNLRSTFIAALSIPLSLLSALIVLRLSGSGLNIMSLGGLAIGTGIIVDDAIVVLENIFRWLSTPELRRSTVTETVVAASEEVLRPVIVSTAANIGIFLPMIFVEGFAGRLFEPVSVAVTLALLASLAVSLTVIPTLTARWLARKAPHEDREGLLHRIYARPLAFALGRPRTTLVLALVPMALLFLTAKRLEVEFLPALDEGAVLLQTVLPPSTSLPESERIGLKLEDWLKKIPGVETVTRRTGHAPGAEDTDNVNHADIMVKLVPKAERPVPLQNFIAALKSRTEGIPDVLVNYLMPLADKINDALGGVPADLGVDLFGPDLTKLHEYADQVVSLMKKIPGIAELRPPSDIPIPSLQVDVKREVAGRLGISEQAIYDAVQAYSVGVEATSVREVQKEIPVVLHFAPVGANFDREALDSLPLKTAGNSTVPLEQVASLSFNEVPSEISHEHLSRKLTVTANLSGRGAAEVASDVKKAVDALKLPPGYSWGFSGKYRTESSALSNMAVVFGLAVLVVAFILWLEFQSASEVGLILLTIPLAAAGASLGLWLCRETLNVSSMIGAVMLVGIVVRNGIMLLDYLNNNLHAGKGLNDAIRSAAQKRIRPILMTASVTVLGLFPIAIGWGTGSELLRPLATAVIGGMVVSTALTLVVLPAAASLLLRGRSLTHGPERAA